GEREILYEYTVTNTGEAPLQIENVKTSCGCLGSEYAKTPIPPGGESKIILKYGLSTGGGAFFHNALVKTNDPQLPIITLDAAGNTDTRVLVNPKSLLFDNMAPGQTKTKIILIHHSGDQSIEVTRVTSKKQRANFTDRKITRELAQELYGTTNARKRIFVKNNSRILQVTYEAKEEDLGKVIEDMVIIHTNIPGFEKITIPIFVKVVPPVALYPGLLTFIDVAPDKNITKNIQALSLEGKEFKVISIHAGDTKIDYATSPEYSNRKEIKLSAKGETLLALSLSDTNLEIEVEMKEPKSKKYTIKMPVHAYSQGKISSK
ncbi:MAG: DUF1573 domain-containing protein, partial [Phycisphaerae bacterium]|nr:DUF1573 domain-containing protein [Phycisphaerae bacterium]